MTSVHLVPSNMRERVAGAPLRGAALVVVWSSGFIGAELGARQAPPDTVLAWRSLAIAAVLLPWLLDAVRRLDVRQWLHQAVLALLCQLLYLGGVFWAAAAGVPAGTSALVASLQPALVLASAVLWGGPRPQVGHLAGLALGTTGVALVAAGDLRAGVPAAALLLPLVAMLALTGGTLLQQHWSSAPAQPTSLRHTLAVQAGVTAVCFTAFAACRGHFVPPPTTSFTTAVAWAAAAGLGSYGLYYLVAARDGATRASSLLYLTPATTALWAAPSFGQEVRASTVAALLVSGSAVVLLRTAPAPQATAAACRRGPRWGGAPRRRGPDLRAGGGHAVQDRQDRCGGQPARTG